MGRRSSRIAVVVLGLSLLAVLVTGWLSSSDRPVTVFGTVDSVLVINDAGPVRVRSFGVVDDALLTEMIDDGGSRDDGEIDRSGAIVRSTQSWLVRSPRVESLVDDGELVLRATCPSRFPCRAALEVVVPVGVALTVVAADDMVQVDSFDGALQVFAGREGVALGSVAGSVSIVSDGPVRGSTLGPSELTVEVVGEPVQLTYLDVPDLLAVVAVDAAVSIELPDSAVYAVDVASTDAMVTVETDEGSDRRISVRSDGRIVVEPTQTPTSE